MDTEGQILEQALSHEELLNSGRHVVSDEGLGAREEALAARAFAAGGQARYLVAPWLVAGFVLNFPESTATRDNDRREIGPTVVLGTRDTYARLAQLVESRLPEPGSYARQLVDWALRGRNNPVTQALAYLIVIRSLRDVIGFSRIRSPLLVGDALTEDTHSFFASLGVQVRTWPDPKRWQRVAVRAEYDDAVRPVEKPKAVGSTMAIGWSAT